jgi:hypothetical protein
MLNVVIFTNTLYLSVINLLLLLFVVCNIVKNIFNESEHERFIIIYLSSTSAKREETVNHSTSTGLLHLVVCIINWSIIPQLIILTLILTAS